MLGNALPGDHVFLRANDGMWTCKSAETPLSLMLLFVPGRVRGRPS